MIVRLRLPTNTIPDGLPPPYTPNSTEYAASEITASSAPPTPTTTASMETAYQFPSDMSLQVAPIPESKFKAKVSHSTICPASTSLSSVITHSTITQSDIHSSSVTHSKINSSSITLGSVVKHTTVTNSRILQDSDLANCKIQDSTIVGAKMNNCTIRNSIVEKGEYNGMKIIDQKVYDHDFLGLK